MQRTVQPEILDSLPPDHPAALHNRRDLRVINRVMGNFRWFLRSLPPLLRDGDAVIELGAGTGDLCRLLLAEGVSIAGLDLWPRPEGWPDTRDWHRADLRAFDGYPPDAVVIGNLILHQFSGAELSQIGATLRRTARVILACEPARRRRSQVLFAALGPLLGANYVSLHDARVSIAAGFLGDELPRALGLDGEHWNFRCTQTALGAYHMIAVRRS